MCNLAFNARLRGVSHDEAHRIATHYAEFGLPVPETLVCALHRAMYDHLVTERPAFVAMFDMVARWYQVRQPQTLMFSVFSGELSRFQSGEMALVHDSVLKFMMSARNVRLMNEVLERYDMAITTMCCCGLIAIEAGGEAVLFTGAWYKDESLRRTQADQKGGLVGPQHGCVNVEDIPQGILQEDERAAWVRIRTILNMDAIPAVALVAA